jgi:hypothetical protein
MCEINKNFDDLYKIYRSKFNPTEHAGKTRESLMKSMPHKRGVYLIWKRSDDKHKLLYIGSSGKIKKGNLPSGQDVRKRMFGSSTPYKFDSTDIFKYGPTTTGVPPARYKKSVRLSDIQIEVFATPTNVAPSVLEHLLIQGYVNQFKDLPEANQKI